MSEKNEEDDRALSDAHLSARLRESLRRLEKPHARRPTGSEHYIAGRLVDSLLSFPPLPQIVMGILVTIFGVGGAVALFGAGLIWGFSILAIVLGPLAIHNGWVTLKRQQAVKEQMELIRVEGEQLVAEVLLLKANDENPVEFLKNRGVTNIHLRQMLLRLARHFDSAG